MKSSSLLERIQGKYQRTVSRHLFKQPLKMRNDAPIISFTFDDFPRSALLTGGEILVRHGVTGTYYASLGLMGKEAPTGFIFLPEDLKPLLEQGHELGCHTFAHCHSWDTSPQLFEQSILDNQRELDQMHPGVTFKTFSYPITCPRPFTKLRVSRHFACSRFGGQTFNVGTVDLNLVSAYFLEKDGGDTGAVKRMIEESCRERGWLVIATHDVADQHSPYGCTPAFFEDVVKFAVNSGAKVVPVVQALELIGADISPN